MEIQEKLFRKELAKIEKRLLVIKKLIEEKPLLKIIELRQKAQNILKKYKGNYKKIGELIGPLAQEEKKQFKKAKEQQRTNLWDEKFSLENDKNKLQNELYLKMAKNI